MQVVEVRTGSCRRWRFGQLLAVVAVMLASSCASSPSTHHAARPPRTLTAGPDVVSRNLPPEQELDALLMGVRSVGKGNAIRVAVPPFRVLGRKDDWMGEAAALVAMSRLSREDGVSVLERRELTKIIDLRRAQQADDAQISELASTGKILGAQEILLGTIFDAGGGKMRVIVRPVRVEDGVSLASTESEVHGERWADDIEQAFDAVVSTIVPSSGASAASTVAPLGRAELELGAKARQLHYQGDLVRAQPLYAKALAQPSSAWKLEADYVRLMTDLGMAEWAGQRARAVMDRMPGGPASMCDRARLQAQITRYEWKLEDARLAVQLAASCGDKVVQAEALAIYATAVAPVDYALANLAFARALAMLGPSGENAWARGWIQIARFDLTGIEGLDEAGGSAAEYERLARVPEAAGNLWVAAASYTAASSAAWLPSKRIELLEHALTLAVRVGGTVEDWVRLRRASQLRDAGKPSAADESLLKILGTRLNAIAALAHGLPPSEAKLDVELLRRAGVTGTARASDIPDDAKLLVKAHRIALAGALREWATRTDLESVRQGKVYREIAEELSPPSTKAPAGETEAARFDRTLADQGLTLERLTRDTAAPLRGSVKSLAAVSDVIWGRYWEAKKKAPFDEVKRYVDAYERVAQWQGSPRLLGNAIRLRARMLFDFDKKDEARTTLATAHKVVTDAAWFDASIAMWEAEFAADAETAMRHRAARVVAAKKSSPETWLTALRANVQLNTATNEAMCAEGLKTLLRAADELEKLDAIEEASRALDLAATTENECAHAGSGGGTDAAVELQQRRAKLLDGLGDPLRSLKAKLAVLDAMKAVYFFRFRGGAAYQMRSDARANALVNELREGAAALAKAGRWRDAARIAGGVPLGPEPAPALLRAGLEWTSHFEDSAEFPMLSGNLHRQFGMSTDDMGVRIKWVTAAREDFKRANALPDVMNVQQLLLRSYDADPELSREFAKCMASAKGDPMVYDDCIRGLGSAIIDHEGGRGIRDRTTFKQAVKAGMDALPAWEGYGASDYHMELLTNLAVIAIVAADMDAFRRLNDRVVAFYTSTAPNAYQLATHLARVATAARTRDVPLFLRLMHAFHDSRGASAFWQSDKLIGAMEAARGARLADEARSFSDIGRDLGYAPFAHRWSRAGYGQMLGERKFLPARKVLEDARKAVRGRSIVEDDYSWAIAEVHALAGDVAGARVALKPVVQRVTEQGDGSKSPCFDSMILETEASLAMAARDCRVGEDMRRRAETTRALCRGTTTLDDGRWSDGTGYRAYHPTNACGAAFVPGVQFLAGIALHELPAVARLACDRGDPIACTTLAEALLNGEGIASDPKAAAALLRKTCDAGQALACSWLATLALVGDGVPKDEAAAYALFRGACDKRHPYACTREAELSLTGTGTATDRARALERFDMACGLGSASGCEQYIENGGKL